ncbi:uncharacterized protein LOC135470573 isoform X2 [Liolophura sinensis]|uniref:uncharacterized protein LOC135470573 isoform X2 n=1 Tax=Liolophura sinensis TaxID=3198878 RepID=UPI003157F415
MGVTLERVQYKFASIIGELCSEPDILSQFAVWVDLRLAEYKLKGSISLDCSGETPDPIWLKGILSALIAKRLAKGKAAVLSSSKCMLATGEDQKVKSLVKLQTPVIRISGPRSAQQTVEPQVTIPPNFIVKGEPEEEKVYPQVSFQDHAYLGDIIRRKRAAETVSSESPKRERVETIPSSQSIVLPDDFQSIPRQVVADEGVTTLLDTASPITGSEYLPAATNETPSPVNQSTGNKSQSSVGDASEMEMAAIRQRKALYKLRSYVTKFDRWVQAEFNESRHMEDIPPEQLDAYLAQFFTTLKTDRGGEYGYDSLITLRSGLEQYLRQKGYPHLIRSSPLFCHSQAAVRKRRLKQAHARHQQAEISNNHNEH